MDIKKKMDFDEFFRSFYTPVCMFIARFFSSNEEMIADIAQDGFLKVYGKWNTFDTRENAQAFLFIAVRNQCLNIVRHKKSEDQFFSDCVESRVENYDFFLDEVMRQETFRLLHEVVDRLPNQTRNIILLTMEGYTNIQISEKLNVSVNTVKTLKKNAYTFLRKTLSNNLLLLWLYYFCIYK